MGILGRVPRKTTGNISGIFGLRPGMPAGSRGLGWETFPSVSAAKTVTRYWPGEVKPL